MYLHPLFAKVPSEDRKALVKRTEIRSYRRNDVILNLDDECGHIFCVGSGLLRVTVGGTSATADITTDFIRQDEFFLCRSFQHDTYKAEGTVLAALPASVYVMPVPFIRGLLLKHPSLTLGLLEHVMGRTMTLRKQLGRLSLSSSEKLVSKILQELTQLAPVGEGGYDKRITQTVIASYSGLSREQVNKTMRDMEQRGLVRKDGSGVHVPPRFGDSDFSGLGEVPDPKPPPEPHPRTSGPRHPPLDLDLSCDARVHRETRPYPDALQ